jgi:hypothetical protein
MTKQGIKEKIEQVKREIFIHDMKDGWDYLDFEEDRRLKIRLNNLEEELAKCEKAEEELVKVLADGSRKEF